ncbi:MAG: DUF2892 domain-containing protein [Saprospiraceae bacterium]
MKKNIGLTDRVLRILVAVAITILYFTHQISGTTAILLGALAILFAVTSLISFCPLYWSIGISTRNKTISYDTRN